MIDIDIDASASDGDRCFRLAARFASDAAVIALYGPSGGGKSMTLQAIAGLLRPQRGHVRIGARVLFDSARGIDLPPEQREVGYLFQHYALFPHLTVRENIAFGLTNWHRRRTSREDANRVDNLLESLELASLAASRPGALSGGQQQRVALARALACRPRVLLLDEPFSALNPLLREGVRAQLADVFARWKMPVVMITHDVDDVLALADVAFVVESGHVTREVDVRGTGSSANTTLVLRPEITREPRGDHGRRVRELLNVRAEC
ncbi:ATP-binding cassette domain-containing protein [Paraburkholderia lycopersici]|uniref:Molybdate transport system ATP-binding protein n=1 Tax=Paraburkholderia lycopersici TaxID=416944 RepID=A0A1G6P3S0_9BURK|nr:ATP-binding cassette domain-containing protein [Paraburkholderia lycopersici]SDC74709.1 molybdate transport system ATP-binding protein [Paraburkholderia lycopersici]